MPRRLLRLSLALLVSACATTAATAEKIRVGWQVPWATQGQIVMALKSTNIAQLQGIDLAYVGFPFGGPLNRAALAGEVDVLFTADQPALTLLNATDNTLIVARLMYNRTCLYVPPASPLTKSAELKGKVIGGPIGAAAERVAMKALTKSGLTASEFRIVNLDMAQQSALLKSSEGKPSWTNVDALFGFDPLPAVFEKSGLARHLDCGNVVSVVVATREMVDKRRGELVAFLRAFQLAWLYYAQNGPAMNRAFAAESKLDVSDDVLDLAASVEPNRTAKSLADVLLTFGPGDMGILDEAKAFLIDKKVIDAGRDYRALLDTAVLKAALAWPEGPAVFGQVKPSSQ